MAKHVVSISIGSSKRNAKSSFSALGEEFVLERIGTDGDLKKAAQMIKELDGKVDAFGLGGMDLYVFASGRRYTFRDANQLAKFAQKTPLVDGSGLKHTLERRIVAELEATIHWSGKHVLLPSAVDRFGMAEGLALTGAELIFGDLIFALGIPVALHSLGQLSFLARVMLPVLTQLPFTWLYPTGEKQESSQPGYRQRYFDWADVIAGDWHYVHRYMPADMKGKIILTNTTTSEDVVELKSRGAKTLITTTPRLGGRSFGTNVMEAMLVALAEKYPLSETEYIDYIDKLGLRAEISELQEEKVD